VKVDKFFVSLHVYVCVYVGSLWRGLGSECASQSESVPVRRLWQDALLVGHANSPYYLGQATPGTSVCLSV